MVEEDTRFAEDNHLSREFLLLGQDRLYCAAFLFRGIIDYIVLHSCSEALKNKKLSSVKRR